MKRKMMLLNSEEVKMINRDREIKAHNRRASEYKWWLEKPLPAFDKQEIVDLRAKAHKDPEVIETWKKIYEYLKTGKEV